MSVSQTYFFAGWLGYGTAFSSLALVEPVDASYARRPIAYGELDGVLAHDISVGTVGPAAVAWGTLLFAGLFSAEAGGTLLAVIPLSRPEMVTIGMTVTAARSFSFSLSGFSGNLGGTMSWTAGAELGRTPDMLPVVACQNLQVVSGTLTPLITSSSSSMTALPLTPPPTGSGQLWNNGGVICIA